MAEPHVTGALRNKRAEPAGTLCQAEQQLTRQRTNLAHRDGTMRPFDPDVRPKDIRPGGSGHEMRGSVRVSASD
jgi:hypothetical protein